MSNPIITRLGISQFWYNYWYSDKLYNFNVKQDYLFKNLLEIYLMYGLLQKSNIFIHEYWYKNYLHIKNIRLKNYLLTKNIFYRRFYYLNKIVSIEHYLLLRNKTAEYFPIKLWIFKYNNWIIYLFNWFKPKKGKKIKQNFNIHANNLLHKPSSILIDRNRFKLFIIWIFKTIYFNYKNYKF